MPIKITKPESSDLKPRITVFGVGGGGGNAVSNMIASGLEGVKFIAANTDAQALLGNRADIKLQLGRTVTEGLGAGSIAEVGRLAAEEVEEDIQEQLHGAHMVFVTAGMGGGTGTGAAPVIARVAKDMGILTVGVVTKPFGFEGNKRLRAAEEGIEILQHHVDTLIVIPNQNLFRIANEKTTFGASFCLADEVLYKGVACITDLIVKEGLINLDFADVRAVMKDMGKAMMGTGEAEGEGRALAAADEAIANPLLDEISMQGARGLLISISGGPDLGLYEVDEAASHIRAQVDQDANVIVGTTLDPNLEGKIKVSVVATGLPVVSSNDRPLRFEVRPGSSATATTSSASTERAAPASAPALAQDGSPAEEMTSAEEAPEETAPPLPSDEASDMNSSASDRDAEAMIAASIQADLLGISRASDNTQYDIPKAGVTVTEFQPDFSMLGTSGPEGAQEASQLNTAKADNVYIPPAPAMASRRMPLVEDLPIIGQRQIEANTSGEESSNISSPTNSSPVQSMWRKLVPQKQPQAERSPINAEPLLGPSPAPQMNRTAFQGEAGTHDTLGRTIPQSESDTETPVSIPAFLRKKIG